MQEAKDFAKKYLEDLLTFFGINIEVEVSSEENIINLNVPGNEASGFLIGDRGMTLRSLQHMVNAAVMNQDFGREVRVTVDVADYKKQRQEKIAEQAKKWAEEVKSSGEAKNLQRMSAAERRVVHKTLDQFDGVKTESEGEGYDRHVVIRPS